MTQEIIEMARQAGFNVSGDLILDDMGYVTITNRLEAFAKLVAAKAIAKDRKEFDIDELCARQNKIGYKQGYRAGQFAEREACAKVCENRPTGTAHDNGKECAEAIRARGEAWTS